MLNILKGKSIIFIIFIFISEPLFSQSPKKTISGFIKDSIENKNIELCTVYLLDKTTFEIIKSTISDVEGKFSFKNIDEIEYILKIQHIGYIDKFLTIRLEKKDISLPIVLLSRDDNKLEDVIIKTKKRLIEQNADKIIYNAELDPLAHSQTAMNLLKKTPYISEDGDGNILVNGQNKFVILLNGKETNIFTKNIKEALKAFPGSAIAKIEIITNPSAKYDAEGVNGVINIITKKKIAGYNATINSSYSTVGFYNFSTNVNLKLRKIGIGFNYGIDGVNTVHGSNTGEVIANQPVFFKTRKYTGPKELNTFWNSGNIETNYEVDSLKTISVYGNIEGGMEHNSNTQNFITTFTSNPDINSQYNLDNKNNNLSFSVGTDFVKKFLSNKVKEFSIRLNFLENKDKDYLNSYQSDFRSNNDNFISNNNISISKEYTIQTDYILPLKKDSKIETGTKYIQRNVNTNYISLYSTSILDSAKINESNSDHFNYQQKIVSGYTSINLKFKPISFRIGLRYEYTEINGNFLSSVSKVNQEYSSILPNLQSSFKVNNRINLILNYNVRIQRPYISNLNPFVDNNDSLNLTFGNPNLQPQTIHALSLQTKFTKGNSFLGFTLNTNYSDNLIIQFKTFESKTGITKTSSYNIGRDVGFNFNTNFSTRLKDKLDLSINSSIRYNKIQNKQNKNQTNDGFGGSLNCNSNYTINSKISANAYGGFWKAPVTIQGVFGMRYWYGIGVSYKLINDKLTININGINFFQQNINYTNKFKDQSFNSWNTNTLPVGGIEIGAAWNFGKLSDQISKKKGVNNDDLIAPTKANN